jgi:hypothetical protein
LWPRKLAIGCCGVKKGVGRGALAEQGTEEKPFGFRGKMKELSNLHLVDGFNHLAKY